MIQQSFYWAGNLKKDKQTNKQKQTHGPNVHCSTIYNSQVIEAT